MFQKDSRNVYRDPALAELPWLDHGFGARDSIDWPSGLPAASLKQIHSDLVLEVTGESGCLGEGDALITDRPGAWLTIRTADCVPVILADPAHHAIAVIHAGWRGAVAGIMRAAFERMRSQFGTEAPRTYASIGPAIGPCCFEVGPEVASRFEPWFPERRDLRQKTKIDLEEAVARQLLEIGFVFQLVSRARICTACNTNHLHSFRRDKESAGRQVTAGAILTRP